ncbi:MAG: response regulator [bacterium]
MEPDARVLVLDDDAVSRMMLSKILQRIGVEVLEAGSTSEAESLLRSHPDVMLVISDILMPEDDGIEFIARIQKDPMFNLKVLFCSSLRDRETIVRARDLSAEGFIIKPLKPSYVAQKVQEVLSKVEPALEPPRVVCRRLGIQEADYESLLAGLFRNIEEEKGRVALLETEDREESWNTALVGMNDIHVNSAQLGANRLKDLAQSGVGCLRSRQKQAVGALLHGLEREVSVIRYVRERQKQREEALRQIREKDRDLAPRKVPEPKERADRITVRRTAR